MAEQKASNPSGCGFESRRVLFPFSRYEREQMKRYRKKPVVIEAIQLRWDTWNDVCEFLQSGSQKVDGCYITDEGQETTEVTDRIGCRIHTIEGTMLAVEGDWIIKGVKGEFYPCKDEIFQATYEPVDCD